MACNYIGIPKTGTHAIVCGRPRKVKCSVCQAAPAVRECDWKVADGKTCDALLCESCTYSPAQEKDLCPAHKAEWQTWRELHRVKK